METSPGRGPWRAPSAPGACSSRTRASSPCQRSRCAGRQRPALRSSRRPATLPRTPSRTAPAATVRIFSGPASTTPRPPAFARTGARPASFAEVLGCDYVSLQLPLTPATRGLIGRAALQHVKPEAFLINVARGAIVDTEALVEALREGRLAGAALD